MLRDAHLVSRRWFIMLWRWQARSGGLHIAGPNAVDLLFFTFSTVCDESYQGKETGGVLWEEMHWGLLNGRKLCLVWEVTRGWVLGFCSGEVLSRGCQIPTDLDRKDAARNISCSEQNPFAWSTRTITEKWKITPSVQPNILSDFPSSPEMLPMDIRESGLKTPQWSEAVFSFWTKKEKPWGE